MLRDRAQVGIHFVLASAFPLPLEQYYVLYCKMYLHFNGAVLIGKCVLLNSVVYKHWVGAQKWVAGNFIWAAEKTQYLSIFKNPEKIFVKLNEKMS